MAKKQEPTISAHPDIVLIDAYEAAKTTIENFNSRVVQVAELLRRKDAQYTEEQIEAAKEKFDKWLNSKYQGRALRSIRSIVDLDLFDPSPAVNLDEIHPDMIALATAKNAGFISGGSVSQLHSLICTFIVDTREEDGALVFGEQDIKEINNIYNPPPATIGRTTQKAPKKESSGDEDKDTGNRVAVATWPGTSVQFKVSYNVNTEKYSFRGRTMEFLLRDLKEAGYGHISEAEIIKWRDTNGPSLFKQ